MIKFSIKILSALGVFLTIMTLAYITCVLAKGMTDGYDTITTFIGGGMTALIGSTLTENVFK